MPYALEPGVALAFVLAVGWWAVQRRGAERVALAAGRGVAHAVEGIAGVGLRAEYRASTRKRTRGATPTAMAYRFGARMARLSNRATEIYARCHRPRREPAGGLRGLLLVVVIPVAVGVALWQLPRYLSVNSPVRFRLAQVESRWLGVRTALGLRTVWAPAPTVVSSGRHPGKVTVRLACRSHRNCSGWLALQRRSHRLHERYVTVFARDEKIISLDLRGKERWIADHGQLRFRRP